MFTVEIKVNGITISTLYGHNEGHMGKDDECQYYFEQYIPEKPLTTGHVLHKRSLGMNSLLVKILKKIVKETE